MLYEVYHIIGTIRGTKVPFIKNDRFQDVLAARKWFSQLKGLKKRCELYQDDGNHSLLIDSTIQDRSYRLKPCSVA